MILGNRKSVGTNQLLYKEMDFEKKYLPEGGQVAHGLMRLRSSHAD